MTMGNCGLIGVGLLGTAITERLLAGDVALIGFDLDAERRDWLNRAGGRAVESAAEVFASSERVVLSLPTSEIVRQVVNDSRSQLRAGQLLIDSTTGDPRDAENLANELTEAGVEYLECTIAGSSEQVRRGEALGMIGGGEAAWQRARDLIERFTGESFWVGPAGQAARMKLVVNLALGLHRAVLAEALALARAAGLDLQLTLDILQASPAASRVMQTKGAKMLSGDFAPQARLAQHLKDVRLIMDLGERSSAHLPLSETHRRLLERAVELGWGDADNSAIIRAFD